MTERFIDKHGGYADLLSYRKAEIVYTGTVFFCDRYFPRSSRDRTRDQMIQAARSGKQNIVEGSMASGTSKEVEIKLTSVARASLEELLEDYRDFIRVRRLQEWHRDDSYALRLRQLNQQPDWTYETFRKGIEHPVASICANVLLGLTKVTNFLLDRQIARHHRTIMYFPIGICSINTESRVKSTT